MSKKAFFLIVALLAAPAWAVNKCTGPDGKVSFQDAPCHKGETVGQELARKQALKEQAAVEQEHGLSDRQAKVEADLKEWEARKKAMGFKSSEDKLDEAKAKCGGNLPALPTIGMKEAQFRQCTTFGILIDPERINETETAAGVTKQFVYSKTSEIRYLYIRNGVVSGIQR